MAQLDSASDYESEGYKFESCQGHIKVESLLPTEWTFSFQSIFGDVHFLFSGQDTKESRRYSYQGYKKERSKYMKIQYLLLFLS